MRAAKHIKSHAVLGFLLSALVLANPAPGVWAAGADICDSGQSNGVKFGVDSAADPDLDGFTNEQECKGLVTGTSGNAYINFTGWNSGSANARNTFLDPSSPDLFVVIVANGGTGSRFTAIGGALTEMINPGSIGIATHAIPAPAPGQGQPDPRTVSKVVIQGVSQKALRVTENRDTNMGTTKSPTPFGSSNWGTPNGLDEATVYTYRIESHVNGVCSGKECKDGISGITVAPGQTNFSPVINQYVKSVVAHEMGHMMKMTAVSDPAFNGNHYAPASKVVMSQNITWVKTDSTHAVYYIPNTFVSPNDASTKKLNGL